MFTSLTRLQACQRLQAHITRNQVKPDLPIPHYIADHVTGTPRLARDARDAVKDIAHTSIAPIPFVLLKDDCARVGVHIPIRERPASIAVHAGPRYKIYRVRALDPDVGGHTAASANGSLA
jgi:hypothetical protein